MLREHAAQVQQEGAGSVAHVLRNLNLSCIVFNGRVYTAPETLFAGTVDARSDLFALGLVLLEEQAASLAPGERQRVERAVKEAKQAGRADIEQQALWGAATFTPKEVARAAEDLPAPLSALTTERQRWRNSTRLWLRWARPMWRRR